jgi:hypothetical protein
MTRAVPDNRDAQRNDLIDGYASCTRKAVVPQNTRPRVRRVKPGEQGPATFYTGPSRPPFSLALGVTRQVALGDTWPCLCGMATIPQHILPVRAAPWGDRQ